VRGDYFLLVDCLNVGVEKYIFAEYLIPKIDDTRAKEMTTQNQFTATSKDIWCVIDFQKYPK
jgi:hypothetical protein